MAWEGRTAEDVVRILVMWVITAFRSLFGYCDDLISTLLVLIGADYITGICVAFSEKKLSSKTGAVGLLKKFGVLCVISLTAVIEQRILETTSLRSTIILYYISNEGISILENLCKMGIPVPEKLRSALSSLKDEKPR